MFPEEFFGARFFMILRFQVLRKNLVLADDQDLNTKTVNGRTHTVTFFGNAVI